MKKIIVSCVMFTMLLGCTKKEAPISDLSKDHSIEVAYETKHLNDSQVLLIRKENVFLKGQLVKSFLRTDTLPAPGDTLQSVETDDNLTKVLTPKEYEFFVTVK